MSPEPELEIADPLTAGREALRRGEWEQAQAYFEAAHKQSESAEAIEALAMAAWWLDDAQLTIDSRERAYRLYRERGDAVGSARMASGSPGTTSRFAPSPLLRAAGSSAHTACSTGSTPSRSMAGSRSARVNSPSPSRTTPRPRGAGPSERRRSEARSEYSTSSCRRSGWRASRWPVTGRSPTGSASWTRRRQRPSPARCRSFGRSDAPAVT
jgi:hypothetical protein